MYPKAPEQCELPSSKITEITVVQNTTLSGISYTIPKNKAGFPPVTGSTSINLQYWKSTLSVLARCIPKLQISIVLVQESWLHKENISRLRSCGQCFSANRSAIRACTLVKGARYDNWAKHCERNLTTLIYRDSLHKRIMYREKYCGLISLHPEWYWEYLATQGGQGSHKGLRDRGTWLVIGCDANLHHTLWESIHCNNRGKALLKFLGTTN